MEKFKTVNGITIYPIDYLVKNELNDHDLSNLFDTPSLLYSFIIGMFEYAGIKQKYSSIINMTKKYKGWYNKYKWNKKQLNEYENNFAKALKNIYCYSDKISKQKSEWYIICYGLRVE